MEYYTFLVCLTIIITLGYLVYNVRERFTTLTSDTIDSSKLDFIKYLVNQIIESLNNRYSKSLELGVFERMETDQLENGDTHYNVKYYINNRNTYSNRKYTFDFVFNEKNGTIVVNSIKGGYSVNNLLERSPISERGSTLYKPKELVSPKANPNTTELEHNSFQPLSENETKVPLLEKAKALVYKEEAELSERNYTPFPSRKVSVIWNCYGISNSENADSGREGLYHGRVTPKIYPTFHPSQFVKHDDEYDWLFDLKSDSSSRPVGVTGSRGSS